MTRINCVPPVTLCQQHLVAEYRELPRIFGYVKRAVTRGETPDDDRNPRSYVLGKGHVRFFYPRLGYLIRRQNSIVSEMKRRGITVNFEPPRREEFDTVRNEWFGDWEPTQQEIAINVARITERMPKNPIFKKIGAVNKSALETHTSPSWVKDRS
jgi:deoxyribonuclease (pyrimidine dimer)